jgi:opacity protein-like surface antigen
MRGTRTLTTAALAMLLAGAATAADVQTTVDPQADLGKYRTFVFLEADPKVKGAITDKQVRSRLRYLIAQHLNKRGYTPAPPGKPGELGVLFSGHVEPKQRVLMTGRPGPYSYDWGHSEIGGQSTLDYREGTLYVDLVDLSKDQLVWRSRMTEALSAGYSEENWKKMDRVLAEAFKKLPARK